MGALASLAGGGVVATLTGRVGWLAVVVGAVAGALAIVLFLRASPVMREAARQRTVYGRAEQGADNFIDEAFR